MATAAVLAPHDVPTSLNYYTPIGTEEPYQYVLSPPEGKEPHNLGVEPHDITVHDARGRENEFSLDKSGFQFVKYPSVEKEFDDDERIKAVYYPEVEALLKEVAGAKRVFIFDHTIRWVVSFRGVGPTGTDSGCLENRRKPDANAPTGPSNRGPVVRPFLAYIYAYSHSHMELP